MERVPDADGETPCTVEQKEPPMNRYQLVVVLAILTGSVLPAPAGIFFNRHPKGDTAEHLPALVTALKKEPDDKKRAAAAEELGRLDLSTAPEAVAALIDALLTDRSSSVRSETMEALMKVRPVSQQIGQALEQCRDNDASFWVRTQAKKALLSYRLHGYQKGKNEEIAVVPPDAAVKPAPLPRKPVQSGMFTETAPPPLAAPLPEVLQNPMPVLQPVPARPRTDGPELTVPQ